MLKVQAGAISVLAMSAVLGWTHGAMAAEAAATNVEEVVVTASRVNAAGFTAPTPTTVLTAADVAKTAPNTVSEALALMPQFRTFTTSSSPAVQANLRNIGPTRTLVMVDGRRHVPTQGDGTLDLNVIPTALIQRTEIVTGGASASWGSDAVAGVVNLILDTHLEGIRGSIQAGESKYGDAKNYNASIAMGRSFFGGRARAVFGADYSKDEGLRDTAYPTFSRPWAYEERGQVSNPAFATNGLPGVLYIRGSRRSDTSTGGLITIGPLFGTTYGANGAISKFGYGTLFSNNMQGGTSNFGENVNPGGDLRYPFERYSALTHAEFDFSDHFTGFAELSYEHSLGAGFTNPMRFQGTTAAPGANPATAVATCTGNQSGVFGAATGAISININNPFIPAATRAAMTAANISCLNMGRTVREFGELRFNDGSPFVWRGVVGLKGDLIGNWTWDGYYQYGRNRSQQRRAGNIDMQKFRFGIDAITSPTTGQTVCRVSVTPPTSTDPATLAFLLKEAAGCVPINIFGDGSITPAMAAYIQGTASLVNKVSQSVAAINLRGDLGHTWAGPISLATGAEYRKDAIYAYVDDIANRTLWQSGSRKGIDPSSTTVKEAYLEAVVPLAKDVTFFKDLSLNGAARRTHYETTTHTFDVTTWKIGATWDINDELRLRATRSQDIRAGNLIELYTAAATSLVSVRNSITLVSSPATITTRGNPNLVPETAETTTVGVVYSPNWFEGLRVSVDYYKISLEDAIGTLTPQQIIDRCLQQKAEDACALITFQGNDRNAAVTAVTAAQLNLNKFDTAGVDAEISYRTPLDRLFSGMPGNLTARVLATRVEKLATTAVINGLVTDVAGQYNNPHNTVFSSLSYDNDRLSVTGEVRWYGGGSVDNTKDCGALTANGINICHVDATTYVNLSASYKLGHDGHLEVFTRVNNLFNEWPPFPNVGGAAGNVNGGFFDEVGRAYRVGVRFKY